MFYSILINLLRYNLPFLFSNDESKDESYAWEAREFLRKKLIGQDVAFVTEKSINTNRTYGTVWLGKGIFHTNFYELLIT